MLSRTAKAAKEAKTILWPNRRFSKLSVSKFASEVSDKAIGLIYGERKYENFTRGEKAIVNSYQDFFHEGGLVFPNTELALEQEEFDELVRKDCKEWR